MKLGIEGCLLVPTDRERLDLSHIPSIENAFETISPNLVVNCAAYTSVELAEDEPKLAVTVNTEGPSELAKLCFEHQVPLIHISTDAVFDGSKTELYLPTDTVNPLSIYGASKEAGERAIREACPLHIILRTSWVFSSRGDNFLKTMLALSQSNNDIRVVIDQTGKPTSAYDIANAIAAIVTKIVAGKEIHWGTYHFCNRDIESWHSFSERIFAAVEKITGDKHCVTPIKTVDYPMKAVRPVNSSLSTESYEIEFNFKPRSLEQALDDVLQDIFK